ncbi:hypothetical protein [Sphaerotilus sp.]|jgi:hypothetical protein|uniref:hypothetical protein n=1 Tax=Sphaerotilus sp. TaxID=2093942 RepID=UPI0025E8178C|nr:hypothetical protein [Sphaerotilus sp.]
MATPNYSYEKRQRELAKKRKTEEKRNRKAHPGRDDSSASADPSAPTDAGQAPQPNAGDTSSVG